MAIVLDGMETVVGGDGAGVTRGEAAAWSQLLAWDAPFLVAPGVRAGETMMTVEPVFVPGVTLAELAERSVRVRVAVAVQLIAAATFLYEQGWLPERRLLRSARVELGEHGPWLRLPGLPAARLDGELGARLASGGAPTALDLLGRILLPLVTGLVPERREEAAVELARETPWEAPRALVAALVGRAYRSALAHPAGPGRPLWSRRFDLPSEGEWWVEEASELPRLAAAVALAGFARGRRVEVTAGAVGEDAVLRGEGRAALRGAESVVLTSLPGDHCRVLPLARDGRAVWVLARQPDRARGWEAAALDAGRPLAALRVLSRGAARGFGVPPDDSIRTSPEPALASPRGRQLLDWLRTAPAGLTAAELSELAGDTDGAVGELVRLGLAHRRGDVLRASAAGRLDAARLDEMVARLPSTSPRAVLAAALRGDASRLVDWCEEQLRSGSPDPVLATAPAAAEHDEVALRCAEAALATGRAPEAGRWLDGIAPSRRDERWRVLRIWHAEQAGRSVEVAAETEAMDPAALPARLAARLWLVRAELAVRRGDRGAQIEALERAAALGGVAVPEAAVLAAAALGRGSLRDLVRRQRRGWRPQTVATALYLLAQEAMERNAYAAAATGFRAALRVSDGANLELTARAHADLGACLMMLEREIPAERHLLLGERLYERIGSRRAATIVRANRAVLACDRLDWKQARRLLLASREGLAPGSVLWCLAELDLARIDVSRGEVAGVERRLPVLDALAAEHPDHAQVRELLAAVRAHVALCRGDMERAEAGSRAMTDGEGRLIRAVVAADRGERPEWGASDRWGLRTTAQLLGFWRSGADGRLAPLAGQLLDRTPLRAAVGLARFVAIVRARGEAQPPLQEATIRACSVLRAAEMPGWIGALRGDGDPDPGLLVRTLDRIVAAGSDILVGDGIEEVAMLLGLDGLTVLRDGAAVAQWGDPDGDPIEVGRGPVRLRAWGTDGDVVRATLELVAGLVPRGDPPASASRSEDCPLLGSSAEIGRVRGEIERWAVLPAPVLITGEPGTGKELVARELHRRSGRAGRFVAVNCAGIPANLIEAELFGVRRGAFSGADRDRTGLVEAADGGTLLLDEVGELPTELQAKLLRVLQEREVRRVGANRPVRVDVRFVAATNRDLDRALASGAFRSDLYYRLAVAVIAVPPLRERSTDVEPLASRFVARHAAAFGRPGVRLSAAACDLLRSHTWPGNVRELDLIVQRAVAAAQPGEVLGPGRFPDLAPAGAAAGGEVTWASAQARLRREYFTTLLDACGGNRSEAARRAGLTRQALLYHLRALGVRSADAR